MDLRSQGFDLVVVRNLSVLSILTGKVLTSGL